MHEALVRLGVKLVGGRITTAVFQLCCHVQPPFCTLKLGIVWAVGVNILLTTAIRNAAVVLH